jgi:hypothetical protein
MDRVHAEFTPQQSWWNSQTLRFTPLLTCVSKCVTCLTAAWLPLFVVLLQVTNALHLSLLHLDDQLALFNDYTREN